MPDLLEEYSEDCNKTGSLLECMEEREAWKSFQCAAGASSPVCCYANSNKDKATADKLNLLKSLYGQNIAKDQQFCQKPQTNNNFKKDCPTQRDWSRQDVEKFYIFNKNMSCNTFLKPSSKGCTIMKNGENHVMPCLGRCWIGMCMNLEVILNNPEHTLAHVDLSIAAGPA